MTFQLSIPEIAALVLVSLGFGISIGMLVADILESKK